MRARTWRIDEDLNVLARVLRVEHEQLADERVCHHVPHFAPHENGARLEQRPHGVSLHLRSPRCQHRHGLTIGLDKPWLAGSLDLSPARRPDDYS